MPSPYSGAVLTRALVDARLPLGCSEFGRGTSGDGVRVADDGDQAAAFAAEPPRGRAVGGVDADRLTGRGTGGADPFQGRLQHWVVRVELAAERVGQIPGPDVDAVYAVLRQRGLQVGERLGRLDHDDAERLRTGHRPATGPVPDGRIPAGTGGLACLGSRVDI